MKSGWLCVLAFVLVSCTPRFVLKGTQSDLVLYLKVYTDDPESVWGEIAEVNRIYEPAHVRVQVFDFIPWHLSILQGESQRFFLMDSVSEDSDFVHVFYTSVVLYEKPVLQPVNGLQWSDAKERQFIALSSTRSRTTFAHEIGHVLGLPHVQNDPTNVMCSCSRKNQVSLNSNQISYLRRIPR